MLTAASAALAAGCTAGHTGVSPVAPSHASSPYPVAMASAPGRAPEQRAEADAASILAMFVPPPGARRLAKAPAVSGGWLKVPQTYLVTNAGVDDTSFWAAPGKPAQLLRWEAAHVSRQFSLGDADYGPPSWDRMFDLPAVPGVLTSRSMVVEVVAIGRGETGIRVDAEVGYLPPRPAGEKMPSAVRAVTIAERPAGAPDGARPPVPVTITDPKVVAELAGLIDSLPLSTIPAAASCPGVPGAVQLLLTFRAGQAGRAVATALTGQSCERVDVTVMGSREPALTGKTSLGSTIITIAGLPWRAS